MMQKKGERFVESEIEAGGDSEGTLVPNPQLNAALTDLFSSPGTVIIPAEVNRAIADVIGDRSRTIVRRKARIYHLSLASLALAASLLLVAGWFIIGQGPEPGDGPTIFRGDLTGDQVMDIADAYRLREMLADKSSAEVGLDLDGSGKADSGDVDWLLCQIVAVVPNGSQQ
jgi:hypothetical protein